MSSQDLPPLDAETFSQLYEHTHIHVFRFIYGLLGGPREEAEDLTAETYTRAWKARRKFRGNQQAAIGWLLRIARNLVIDSRRRASARGMHLIEAFEAESYAIAAPEPGPEDQINRAEQLRILWSLLQSLPDDRREMIVLRYILDWRVKDIAAYMNIAENTVSVILQRTISRFQRDWPDNGS